MSVMTPEQRMKCLSPSHHHFERLGDIFHREAFVGMPDIEDAIERGFVVNLGEGPGITTGKRKMLWYSVDWCGNLIGEWGEDTPPGEEESQK